MQSVIAHRADLPGRGTLHDPANRFDTQHIEAFDDGWDRLEEPAPPQTVLIRDATRSILSWNESPDLGFDRSVNPYRGCEHGCVYCYARPSHAYLGFSPGLDFETKLVFKPDAAGLLEREISRKSYQPAPIMLGSNTDPYQPVERQLRLTRAVLEVLERYNHPVTLVTKSAGVLRDIDILGRMAARNLVRVYLSVTTLDPRLARAMEPRAATPLRRVQAIAELSAAKIPVGVLAAPMIPGLNDAELETILRDSAQAGALYANAILLRLPLEVRDLMTDWLNRIVPDRAARILALIREVRGGELNDSTFGRRFTGQGPYAALLTARFKRAARHYGLERTPPALDCTGFIRPHSRTNSRGNSPVSAQPSLFDL